MGKLKIGSRSQVINGNALKTKDGYTKKDLYYNDKNIIHKLNKSVDYMNRGGSLKKREEEWGGVGEEIKSKGLTSSVGNPRRGMIHKRWGAVAVLPLRIDTGRNSQSASQAQPIPQAPAQTDTGCNWQPAPSTPKSTPESTPESTPKSTPESTPKSTPESKTEELEQKEQLQPNDKLRLYMGVVLEILNNLYDDFKTDTFIPGLDNEIEFKKIIYITVFSKFNDLINDKIILFDLTKLLFEYIGRHFDVNNTQNSVTIKTNNILTTTTQNKRNKYNKFKEVLNKIYENNELYKTENNPFVRYNEETDVLLYRIYQNSYPNIKLADKIKELNKKDIKKYSQEINILFELYKNKEKKKEKEKENNPLLAIYNDSYNRNFFTIGMYDVSYNNTNVKDLKPHTINKDLIIENSIIAELCPVQFQIYFKDCQQSIFDKIGIIPISEYMTRTDCSLREFIIKYIIGEDDFSQDYHKISIQNKDGKYIPLYINLDIQRMPEGNELFDGPNIFKDILKKCNDEGKKLFDGPNIFKDIFKKYIDKYNDDGNIEFYMINTYNFSNYANITIGKYLKPDIKILIKNAIKDISRTTYFYVNHKHYNVRKLAKNLNNEKDEIGKFILDKIKGYHNITQKKIACLLSQLSLSIFYLNYVTIIENEYQIKIVCDDNNNRILKCIFEKNKINITISIKNNIFKLKDKIGDVWEIIEYNILPTEYIINKLHFIF